MKTTITEALAEIKTTMARVDKKQSTLQHYLVRDSRLKDPLAKEEGGSAGWVKRERQSIDDLQAKLVRIRSAIQAANLAIRLTIEGQERSLAEWLNWRREIAEPRGKFLAHMANVIANARTQIMRQQQTVARETTAEPNQAGDLVINVDEATLAREIEQHANILGQLDGKLSLLNATTTIEV